MIDCIQGYPTHFNKWTHFPVNKQNNTSACIYRDDIGMKFTLLSLESSYTTKYIFEGLYGPLRCNMRYTVHQIHQNRHGMTESKIASL